MLQGFPAFLFASTVKDGILLQTKKEGKTVTSLLQVCLDLLPCTWGRASFTLHFLPCAFGRASFTLHFLPCTFGRVVLWLRMH